MKKTRKVSYYDPKTRRQVEKEIAIPPAAKVHTLGSGATVEEIPSMAALREKWGENLTSDLVSPLCMASRENLRDILLAAIKDPSERLAITNLVASSHFDDDRILKLVGRLVRENMHEQLRAGQSMSNREQLIHEKAILVQDKENLCGENRKLHDDVKKLVEERDTLRRKKGNSSLIDEVAKLSIEKQDLANAKSKLNETLTEQVKENNKLSQERDSLLRDAQRNLELALTDYETEILGKLGNVAEDHNKVTTENTALKAEVAKLTGEKNLFRSQVEHEKQVNRQWSDNMNNVIAKVKREREMSEAEQNVNETEEAAVLRAGDEVFCKVSGEGPFVLMTQVDEAVIEYANPISNKRNSFAVGKLPIHNAWLVRCKDGSMRTLPAPVLTKEKPKSSLSFGGVKRLVTSDVTSKLFQAAIWVTMLTLLYMRS